MKKNRMITCKISALLRMALPLLCLSLGSCMADHNEPGILTDGIVLRLSASGDATRGSVDTGSDAENRIEQASVWFYRQGAGGSEAPLYVLTAGGLADKEEVSLAVTTKMLVEAGMDAQGTYDLYVIANMPAGLPLNNTTGVDDLKKYIYTATDRPASPFSMSGVKLANDFSQGREVRIPLIRRAVKLNVTFINETAYLDWTISSVKVRGDRKQVALFESSGDETAKVLAGFDSDLTVSDIRTTDSPASYETYIYENWGDVPVEVELQVTINGEIRTYKAEITPDNSPVLPGNTVCMVTLRIKDAVRVDASCIIQDWDNVSIDAPINASYLRITENKVKVDPGNGGYLHMQTDASSVHVDWSEAPGFILDGSMPGETSADIAVTDNWAIVVFEKGRKGEGNSNPADGVITVTAGTLTRKIGITMLQSLLMFDLKSITVNGHEIKYGDTVPWDLWGGDKGTDNDNLDDVQTLTVTLDKNMQCGYTINLKFGNGEIGFPANGTYVQIMDDVAGGSTTTFELFKYVYGMTDDHAYGTVTITLTFGLGDASSSNIPELWTPVFDFVFYQEERDHAVPAS